MATTPRLDDQHYLRSEQYRPEEVGFSLDNGARHLRPWFTKIGCDEFADGLDVTEAEPLVAYVRSTRAGRALDAERIARLRAEIEKQIAAEGAFRVMKRTGTFTCGVEAMP